ncbi:MAG: hypothetical protein CSA95_08095 [Bacteroidetes bacterium]|nr:MAG: hypothetical protein CSA95_08095 [Bacteroidota bacterium]
MSQAKKFGTFAGVFTPSILTILGVIMYMRLGWVVGQAGLINTLVIILVAHIISITTGLSISSIATDKKIRTGGIYYILSRSLGLPAGGAIGITIFIGTALSISLYIVGFTESFLSLDVVSNFLHLTPGIPSYRLVGSVVAVILVILALISTSVVIKTQFFILGAIALSIVSIVGGLLWGNGYMPSSVAMTPIEGSESMAIIFGIFFPAATGFTAGVAMSGDLKDPKNAIPKGTMIAIGTGLIVYVALAFLLSFFVRRDMLLNDPDFLLKIALFSPLVIAGIWGATLSSALGGILGAPRIMQAMSQDKLSPRMFAKGYGKNNEPRAALILTFILAEVGILIGELNVIARVVSMFYIAAYGFINLAFTLENWASSDFRPSFRINKWVGIIGFIACFAVMYELDAIAMAAAIVIIAIVYIILRRQKLRSELGDVWTSVWNSLTRKALTQANQRRLEERNWRPNIILFSGGTNSRPHLVDFGQWMVGKHGFLSNFDLTEGTHEENMIYKRDQNIRTKGKEGIFVRNHVCTDIYEGIETIAKTYGFSGIEPNTVLMGWARQTKEPERFVQMLENLSTMDLNVLMLDYDQRKGFGKQRLIDLYMTPWDINGLFPLYLVRFLWYTEEWGKSRLRLFILNDENQDSKSIFRAASNLLDKVRIDGEIRVLNNHFEKKPHHQIILQESQEADLVILGIPDFTKQNNREFIHATDILCRDLGSVLLVKASSEFDRLNLSYQTKESSQTTIDFTEQNVSLPPVIHPELKTICSKTVHALQEKLEEYGEELSSTATLIDDYFRAVEEDYQKALQQTKEILSSGEDSMVGKRTLFRKLVINLRSQYTKAEKEIFPAINSIIINTSDRVISELRTIYDDLPEALKITYGEETTSPMEGDSEATKRYRKKLSAYLAKHHKGKEASIPIQKIVKGTMTHLPSLLSHNEQQLIELIISHYVVLEKLHDTLVKSYPLFFKTEDTAEQLKAIQKILQEIATIVKEGVDDNAEKLKDIFAHINNYTFHASKAMIELLNQPVLSKKSLSGSKQEKQLEEFSQTTEERIGNWKKNQKLLANNLMLEINLMLFNTIAESSSNEIIHAIDLLITDGVIANHKAIIQLLKAKELSIQKTREIVDNNDYANETNTQITNAFSRLQRKVQNFPETYEILSHEFYNELGSRAYDLPDTVTIKSQQLLDHLYQQEFTMPINKLLHESIKVINRSKQKEQEIITRLSVSGFTGKEQRDFIHAHIEILEDEIQKLTLLREEFIEKIYHIFEVYSNRLSIQPFLRTASNLRHYIRNMEREKSEDFLTRTYQRMDSGVRRFFTNLWYRQSRGILLHERLLKAEKKERSEEQISRITAASSSRLALSEIPFHYHRLFLRKQQYAPEFWIGREREIAAFEVYKKQYHHLKSGAILVTGERYSGKTYFCEHVAAKDPVYIVSPPLGGSLSPKTFYAILANSLEAEKQNWEEALKALPQGTTIIFDNMELWWSRSTKGHLVLDIIQKIINTYSSKILFICNVSSISYKVIRNITDINNIFIGEVELLPFDAHELETIIMRRHRAGGIPFQIEGRNESNYRPWHYARLFTRYFNYSNGNIGIALYNWISNITAIEDKTLIMRYPILPDDLPLEALEERVLFSLIQLVIHQQMSSDKLARVMQLKREEALSILETLYKKNLAITGGAEIYEPNPVMYQFIVERLIKEELI